MTVKLWNLLTCISLSGSFMQWSIGMRVLQGRAMKKGGIMLMSAQVCIALVSVAVGADPPFEGTKAGDVRELAPGIVFRWCPAGTFMMGENRRKIGEKNRQAEVTLTSGFWLGETEVTQGQWSQFMESSPWSGKAHVKEGPDFAASCISHDDAVSFCEKLTTQQRNAGTLPKDWKYSLPTDAQWEYGCRAGTKTIYSFGDDESQLGEYGWFSESALEIGERYAHKVGQKKPNAWGLKDMHGNVWEWCSDWYRDKLQGGPDPVGPASGRNRVFRGGSWAFDAHFCESGQRYLSIPDYQCVSVGFRIAAVLK